MVVEDIMTRDPVTIEANASVSDALRALHDLDARHLPVVDGSELVGMLSDRDVRPVEDDALDDAMTPDTTFGSGLDVAISEIMSSSVSSVSPEDDIVDAIDLMISQRVGALPVVDAASCDLVGIVSYVDILRAARDLL
jgi:acetoin utilization protein AcuB